MKRKFRKYWEVMWIRIAARILIDRNFKRSAVVSPLDNNDMWYMSERLDAICERMLDEYKRQQQPIKPQRGESCRKWS